jgi:hypothetical protein
VLRTLKVSQLIAMLEDEDPDALVVFACDYGDYHHTQQALAIEGCIQEEELEKSAYSQSGWAVRGEGEEEDPAGPTVLVLR